ncbi:ABC transporter permease [Streptomyces sp. Ru71]|nr:ABC transporter permease [Streptomyces sp. Ru71]
MLATRRSLLWALLLLVVALYAFPFLYLVLTSFKAPSDALAVPPTVLPKVWSHANFTSALNTPGTVPAFVNSVTTAVLSTVVSLVLAVPAAYAVTRFGTPSGRVFIVVALVTRMVPPVAVGVPLTGMMKSLNLTDTPLGTAIAHTTISLPLSIWLLTSFFEAVPAELEDAAKVDGCGRLGALTRVVLPVVRSGVAVTAVFAFLASWNEFLFALLLTAVRAQTVPILIADFQTQYGLQWGPMTAMATLYSIPVILLTLVLQRRIVAGLTLGAVKG